MRVLSKKRLLPFVAVTPLRSLCINNVELKTVPKLKYSGCYFYEVVDFCYISKFHVNYWLQ